MPPLPPMSFFDEMRVVVGGERMTLGEARMRLGSRRKISNIVKDLQRGLSVMEALSVAPRPVKPCARSKSIVIEGQHFTRIADAHKHVAGKVSYNCFLRRAAAGASTWAELTSSNWAFRYSKTKTPSGDSADPR